MQAILSINKLGVIGDKGKMAWNCKEDLAFFKKMTMGKNLLCGRKTADNLPKLKGRNVFVASKNGRSIKDILAKENIDYVIGGAEIFKQTLDKCDIIHCSRINDCSDGDTYFSLSDKQKEKTIYYEFNI